MNILYLKNYKGFVAEYIPLKNVNFFVGDNSTGKTSIIKLIERLQKKDFWTRPLKDSFSETINQNTSEKYFEIGFAFNKKGHKNINAVYIQYLSVNNKPQISKIKVAFNNSTIFADIEKDKISIFKKIDFTKIDSINEFQDWINTQNKNIDIKTDCHCNSIKEIVELITNEKFITPSLFNNLIPQPPIRTEPKDKYLLNDSPFSNLNDILDSIKSNKELHDFGKKSSLFDEIKFAKISKEDFAIKIKSKNIDLPINSVGYGVSQVLPLLIDLLYFNKSAFTLQQPEIHLHPKAQAEFGEFVFNATQQRQNSFIIETHSDYLIDRFRYCLHLNEINFQSQIVFFKKGEGGNNKINIINILENGTYEESMDLSNFREFFINEIAKIWEI